MSRRRTSDPTFELSIGHPARLSNFLTHRFNVRLIGRVIYRLTVRVLSDVRSLTRSLPTSSDVRVIDRLAVRAFPDDRSHTHQLSVRLNAQPGRPVDAPNVDAVGLSTRSFVRQPAWTQPKRRGANPSRPGSAGVLRRLHLPLGRASALDPAPAHARNNLERRGDTPLTHPSSRSAPAHAMTGLQRRSGTPPARPLILGHPSVIQWVSTWRPYQSSGG